MHSNIQFDVNPFLPNLHEWRSGAPRNLRAADSFGGAVQLPALDLLANQSLHLSGSRGLEIAELLLPESGQKPLNVLGEFAVCAKPEFEQPHLSPIRKCLEHL